MLILIYSGTAYRETFWLEPQGWRGCSSPISLALFIKAFRIAMTIIQSIWDKGSPCRTPCHSSVWCWINLPGTPFIKACCGGTQKIEHHANLKPYSNWSNLPINKIFLFLLSFSLCIQVEFEVKFGDVIVDIIIKTHCDFLIIFYRSGHHVSK